jgi:hypothetical protein
VHPHSFFFPLPILQLLHPPLFLMGARPEQLSSVIIDCNRILKYKQCSLGPLYSRGTVSFHKNESCELISPILLHSY